MTAVSAKNGQQSHLIQDPSYLDFEPENLKKRLLKILLVFDFVETFSPLISVVPFASGRVRPSLGTPEGTPPRYGRSAPSLISLPSFATKSLFQNQKKENLKPFS